MFNVSPIYEIFLTLNTTVMDKSRPACLELRLRSFLHFVLVLFNITLNIDIKLLNSMFFILKFSKLVNDCILFRKMIYCTYMGILAMYNILHYLFIYLYI